MSESERPPLAWIRIDCSLVVALSRADTLTMPLASMSKVTSTWGTPRGAGGMPTRSNWPSSLLSAAIGGSRGAHQAGGVILSIARAATAEGPRSDGKLRDRAPRAHLEPPG